jgi:hypothetical protein
VPDSGLNLSITPEALRPLIRAVVQETVAALDEARAATTERLAYPEAEAARLLGLRPHQLRDARLRGEIEASVGPGKRILYRHADLERYLLTRRWQQNGQATS